MYKFRYLLNYLHSRRIKREEIYEKTQMARQTAGWKGKINNCSTTESELWRNAGPSAFQFQESYAPLKLRPYGAIQMCILLLLLLC